MIRNLWTKIFLKAVVSAALLIWVIVRVNWHDVWAHLRDISPLYIILYVVLLLVGMLISSAKWRMIAREKGI